MQFLKDSPPPPGTVWTLTASYVTGLLLSGIFILFSLHWLPKEAQLQLQAQNLEQGFWTLSSLCPLFYAGRH